MERSEEKKTQRLNSTSEGSPKTLEFRVLMGQGKALLDSHNRQGKISEICLTNFSDTKEGGRECSILHLARVSQEVREHHMQSFMRKVWQKPPPSMLSAMEKLSHQGTV